MVNMNIWSCSWHLLCVRLTFGPSIPSRAPPNTAVLLCPSSALRAKSPQRSLAKDPGLVPGTTCMAAFCLMWLRLHLQSSEGSLPLCHSLIKSFASWLFLGQSSTFSSSGHRPPLPVFANRIPFPFSVLFVHSGLSAVRWDCGSVTSPPTAGTGGRWGELFGVVPQLARFF